jgi:hypothetical protein
MAIAAAPRSMPSNFSSIRPPKERPIKIGWADRPSIIFA